MQNALDEASQYVDKANISKCFEVLQPIVPKALLHEFNVLRNDYLDKGVNWRDTDRLRAFIGKLRTLPTEKKALPAPSRRVWWGLLAVGAVFGLWWVGKPAEEKKKQEAQNFHIIILPFLEYCDYEKTRYNAGKAIEMHLQHLIARDKLLVTTKFLADEKTENITDQRAEELRQIHKADMVIYGIYQTNACSAKGDQICLNYITDSKWGLGSAGKNLDRERFVQGGLEELKTGKVQEKVENIALFVSVLAQVKNIDHTRYMQELQGVLQNNIDNKLRAEIFFDLGEMMSKEGKYEGAYRHYQQAIKLYEQEKDEYMVSVMLNRIGNHYIVIGKAEEALRYHQRVLQIGKRRFQQDSTNANKKQNFAIAHHQIGNVYETLQKYKEALSYQQQYLKLIQELHTAYPDNKDFKQNLGIASQRVGIVYEKMEEPAKALPYLAQYLKISQELHKTEPENVDYQYSLSVAYSRMGRIYEKEGKPQESLPYYEKKLHLIEKICKAEPTNVEYKNNLGLTYNTLGNHYYNYKKDKAQAKAYFQKAHEIFKELVQNSPENVRLQENLRVVEGNLEGL